MNDYALSQKSRPTSDERNILVRAKPVWPGMLFVSIFCDLQVTFERYCWRNDALNISLLRINSDRNY